MQHVSATVVTGLFLLPCLSANTAGASSPVYFRPGSAVVHNGIYKSIDAQWFHISEACDLRVWAEDKDDKCAETTNWEWEEIDENYINYAETNWIGDDISGSGQTVTWNPTDPTGQSGVTVSAQVFDNDVSPDQQADDTEDPNGTSASRQMYAYDARLTLDLNGSVAAGNTVTLEEEETVTESLDGDLDHATIKYHGNSSGLPHGDAIYTHATWTYKTDPDAAALNTGGDLIADIKMAWDCEYYIAANDGDINDGTVSVGSFTISAGTGVSVGYSTPAISFGSDVNEAAGAIGIGYTSDHLGGLNELSKTELKSSPNDLGPAPDESRSVTGITGDTGWETVARTKADPTTEAEVRFVWKGEVKDDDVNHADWMEYNPGGDCTFYAKNVTYRKPNNPPPAEQHYDSGP